MSKSKIVTLAAMAAALAVAGAAYPCQVEIHNNSFRLSVEPETSTEIQPYSVATATVKDEAQLQRMLSNIEALNTMAGWPEGVGMSLHYPRFVPDEPVAEASKAAVPDKLAETTEGGGAPPGDASTQQGSETLPDKQVEEKKAADTPTAGAKASAGAPKRAR